MKASIIRYQRKKMLTSINVTCFLKYSTLDLEKLGRINFIFYRSNIGLNHTQNSVHLGIEIRANLGIPHL